jgi:hypothetical protein
VTAAQRKGEVMTDNAKGIKQVNFQRLWPRISQWLNERDVTMALHFGLMCQNQHYEIGNPPWLEGRGPLNGQRARCGKLSWFQPWGRCHAIAPFARAICKRLYPGHVWGFLTSDIHTVVVGLDTEDRIKRVGDILLFKELSAKESLAMVNRAPSSLCFNPGELNTGNGWTQAWDRIEREMAETG